MVAEQFENLTVTPVEAGEWKKSKSWKPEGKRMWKVKSAENVVTLRQAQWPLENKLSGSKKQVQWLEENLNT